MSKFANVAIKCDTYIQILHLAELARKERLQVGGLSRLHGLHFKTSFWGYYSNFTFAAGTPVIEYEDFIKDYTHDEYMRNVVHSMD
jgi:hypothetical protein